jgi:hypothetical protein
LLTVYSGKAVSNTSVTGDLSRFNSGIGILCLDDEFDTLNGGCAGLGDSTRDTSCGYLKENRRFLNYIIHNNIHLEQNSMENDFKHGFIHLILHTKISREIHHGSILFVGHLDKIVE